MLERERESVCACDMTIKPLIDEACVCACVLSLCVSLSAHVLVTLSLSLYVSVCLVNLSLSLSVCQCVRTHSEESGQRLGAVKDDKAVLQMPAHRPQHGRVDAVRLGRQRSRGLR
jgi:hypothetical protein